MAAAKINFGRRLRNDTPPARLPEAKTSEHVWATTAVFTICAALYWLTRTHYNTFDAVSYSNQIAHRYPRTGDFHWLFHPHHLLFNATGYLLWIAAKACGYRGGPLVVLESFNAIVSAAGIAVFYAILRSLMQRSRWLPLLIAFGLAVSFGYWTCATDARVNAASTTLTICAFAVLYGMRERASILRAACAGILAGFAVLYHESAGLFVGVGLTAMFAMPASSPQLRAARSNSDEKIRKTGSGATVPSRIRLAGAFVAAWAGIVVLAYGVVGVGVLGLHSIHAFHAWSAEYAELGWWWNFHIAHNLRLDAYALRHAAFVEPPGKQGTFHLSADTPTGLLGLYFMTLAGWFIAIYYFAVALPLVWRTHNRPILIMSLVWILLYSIFFTVWSPGYFVFWVPVLMPISLLLALTMAHFRSQRAGLLVNWLVGAWIVMYATVNLVSSISPHLQPLSSPYQRIALEYRQHTHPGDLVLIAGDGDLAELEPNISYFADRDCLSIHTALTRHHDDVRLTIQALQKQIAGVIAAGHDVYLSDDLWRMGRYQDVIDGLKAHHRDLQISALKPLFAPWQGAFAWPSDHGSVWKLIPHPKSLGSGALSITANSFHDRKVN